MNVNLGALDRRGRLFRATVEEGLGGTQKQVLLPIRDIPLTQVTPSTRSVIAGARSAEETENVWMTRWFQDLECDMVLQFDGRNYRVVRRDEMGRRQGWKIYGREIGYERV